MESLTSVNERHIDCNSKEATIETCINDSQSVLVQCIPKIYMQKTALASNRYWVYVLKSIKNHLLVPLKTHSSEIRRIFKILAANPQDMWKKKENRKWHVTCIRRIGVLK
jgi:hypothetical protein